MMQVFRCLGNKRPKSLIQIENHILMAAMTLSHGEDLAETMTSLHMQIKGCEDMLTRDLEACNWFDLSIPTDLLNCQPSQSLPSAEINYASVLQTAFQHLVAYDQETRPYQQSGGLVSPPNSPNTFPSASSIDRSPCINPQLLQLCHLSLGEDVSMADDTQMQIEMQTEQDKEFDEPQEHIAQLDDLDCSDDNSRREEVHEEHPDGMDDSSESGSEHKQHEEDEDAMRVKESEEEEGQDEQEEEGEKEQEAEGKEQQEGEEQENEVEVDQRGM